MGEWMQFASDEEIEPGYWGYDLGRKASQVDRRRANLRAAAQAKGAAHKARTASDAIATLPGTV
jgi:hypothetical protein